MKATILGGLALATLFTLAGVASAQTYGSAAAVTPGNGFGGGYGGYGFGYHSSTYEEGVLRGLGDLRRSTGEMNYLNSLANINNQEAVSRYLANREQKTETYFRMQQINRAAREATRSQPLSPEQYAVLAKKQAPDRLSEGQYDRVLGRLHWPMQLQGTEFAEERATLDKMFAGRAATDTGIGSGFHADVRFISGLMHNKLQANLATMTPMEFIAAKKFLTGLAYEAQQPFAVEAVAVVAE